MHFRFFSDQPSKIARPSFAVFSRRVVGEPYASFARPSSVFFGPPSFVQPHFWTTHLNPPPYPLRFPRLSLPQSVGTLTGVFRDYISSASVTRRTLAKSFEVLSRPLPTPLPHARVLAKSLDTLGPVLYSCASVSFRSPHYVVAYEYDAPASCRAGGCGRCPRGILLSCIDGRHSFAPYI